MRQAALRMFYLLTRGGLYITQPSSPFSILPLIRSVRARLIGTYTCLSSKAIIISLVLLPSRFRATLEKTDLLPDQHWACSSSLCIRGFARAPSTGSHQ